MATKSKFHTQDGIKTLGNAEVDGSLTVTGNFTVNGEQTIIDSTTQSVTDSMIELASGNTTSDTLDVGIYGNYNDGLSGEGDVSEYTGLFRDASDSTWKLYDGLEVEPTTTVNTSGSGFTLADLKVGDLTATTLTATNSITGASITYPTTDGTSGQVIKTNGSGTLSFGSATLDSLSDCTISSATPSSTTNPPYAGAMWIEEDTGDVYVCTNATTNNNTWVKTGSADGIVTSGSTTIIQSEDDTNVIHVTNSAEVGIGTASPTAKLHVESNGTGSIVGLRLKNANTQVGDGAKINFTGGTSTEGAGIAGYGTALNKSELRFYAGGDTERLRIGDTGNMHLGSDDSDVLMYIGSAGGAFGGNSSNHVRGSSSNLMLNTPGQFIVEKEGSLGILMDTDKSFYVRPATSADNFGMYVRTSNSADTGMKIGRTGTNNAEMGIKVSSQGSNSFASFKFAISDATTWSSDDWFKLKVSGEMDGNFNDTSDQNLKENIVSIPNGDLAKVMQLNPVTFDWKNAVSRNDQTGFIAQEVETIFPNEVLGDAYDVEVEGSGKSINTIGLLSHTVKAMQEMKTLIDTLETRITTLENA
jgi:hypothetical protein